MKLWPYLLAGLALLLLIPAAQAASAVQDSCALARQPDVSSGEPNWRQWVAWTGTAASCSIGSGSIDQVSAGAGVDIGCQGGTVGPVAPLGAEIITISLVSDATSFPSATPTAIRSYTLSAGEVTTCNSGPTGVLFTFYCTDDGTISGTPKHGIVRLHIRAQRTTIPTYDTNSDTTTSGLYGVIRCNTALTSLVDSNPPSGANRYKGGDLIGLSHSSNTTAYRAADDINLRVTCDASRIDLGTDKLSTMSSDLSQVLKGSRTTWPNGCDLKGYLNPQQSALSGFTAYNYTTFDIIPGGTSATGDGGVLYDIPKTLDRLLITVPGGRCDTPFHKTTGADVTKRNLGQDVLWQCQWAHNATFGTTGPVNNGLFKAYICNCPINGSSYGADVATTVNGTFATSNGEHDSTHTIKTTYEHLSPPEDVVDSVIESYALSRTDAELLNYGGINETGTPSKLIVSETLTFDSLRNSKTAGGANASTFNIGADEQYLTPLGLRDATGDPYPASPVSCDRVRPDNTTEETRSFGTTDANGDASELSYVPKAPSGEWRFDCSTGKDGNSGFYTITFVYQSTFTGDITIGVAHKPHNATHTNFTVILRQYDPVTDDIVPVLADNNTARLYIKKENGAFPVFQVVPGSPFNTTQACPTCAVYYVLVETDLIETDGRRVMLYAHANITQSPFISGTQYLYGRDNLLDISLTTAIDPYIPIVLWGLLLIMSFRRQAWLPGIAAMSNLGASLFDPDVYSLEAQVMLFAISYVLYHLAERGMMPRQARQTR